MSGCVVVLLYWWLGRQRGSLVCWPLDKCIVTYNLWRPHKSLYVSNKLRYSLGKRGRRVGRAYLFINRHPSPDLCWDDACRDVSRCQAETQAWEWPGCPALGAQCLPGPSHGNTWDRDTILSREKDTIQKHRQQQCKIWFVFILNLFIPNFDHRFSFLKSSFVGSAAF